MRKSIAGIFGVVLLGAAWLRAGDDKPSYHESSQVSLVQVPVNVVGRDGKPVRGLTLADFHLEDDGKPQQLLYLDVADLKRNAVVPALPSTLPAAARRHFLLLFDLSFAKPIEIVRSREAAMKFIANVLEPEDLAAVGTTSAETGARLLVNFTSDRAQLLTAIQRLGLPEASDHPRDPLAFAFVLPGDPHLIDYVPTESYQRANVSEIVSNIRIFSMMAQRNTDDAAIGRVENHLGGMGSLAEALDAVEGRKTIIYFSEGFDGRLLLGNMIRSEEKNFADNQSMMTGEYWSVDLDKRFANSSLQRKLSDTMSLFRRSDCTVYPVDIAGLKADNDVAMGDSSRGEESLYAIASETGGEVLKNGNDMLKQMQRIAERTSLTYVLSFTPSESRGPGYFHRLKVKVNAHGAKVSARAGYYESRDYRKLTPLERSLAAADVIMHEKEGGTLPLEVLAMPLEGSAVRRVPVLVEMPPAAIAELAGGDLLHLGLYVYATDDNGKLADYFTRFLTIDLTRERARLSSGGLLYYGVCRLPPGSYVIRAYVRDEDRGLYGYRSFPLAVPDVGGASAQAPTPVFLRDGTAGVNLRDAADAEGPFRIGDSAFVPQLDPPLAEGSRSRVCLLFFRGKGDEDPIRLRAEIVNGQGRTVAPANVSLIGRSAADASGLMKLLLDFQAPGLPAGDYALRVSLCDPEDQARNLSSEAKFHIS